MSKAVIVSASRVPTGRFLGALQEVSAIELGATTLKATLERAGIDAGLVEEVIMGQVVQAGSGQNPARQAALRAGLSNEVGALTINKVCGSGLKAVILAAQSIRAGDQRAVLAGGMESMSNSPYLLPRRAQGYRAGNQTVVDANTQDGLWCSINDEGMGMTGERVADKYGIGREAQDEYAAGSHAKAVAAQQAGRFDDRDRAGDGSRAQGRHGGQPGRGTARRLHCGESGQTQTRLQERRRHRHGGQRAGPQRRRGQLADHE